MVLVIFYINPKSHLLIFLLNVKYLFIFPDFSLPPKNRVQNKPHKCGLNTLRSSELPMKGNLLRTSESLNIAMEIFATYPLKARIT